MAEKEGKKEAKRMSFFNLQKNATTIPQNNLLKVQSGNIKRTISVFEQLSCPKQLPDKHDIARNARSLSRVQNVLLMNENGHSCISLEKKENIKMKAISPLNRVELGSDSKIMKEGVISERRPSSWAFLSSNSKEFDINKEKTPVRKSLLDPVEKKENREELRHLKSNSNEGDIFSLEEAKNMSKDSSNKSLDEKFFELESYENTFHINDLSGILCNSLESGSLFEEDDLKNESSSAKERSEVEKVFNEKYSKLIQQNNELRDKNKHYEEVIGTLNKEIEEKSSLMSKTEDNKYIEQINSLGYKVEKLTSELNNSSTYNEKLLEQINFCKLESQLSTDILKSEIEKSKDIIKSLEEQLKNYDVNQSNFHEHLESVKLYYIEREKALENKLISAEQAIDDEKIRSTKNMKEIQKKLEESDLLKKNVEERLSFTLTENNKLLKEISYLRNNYDIKDNYESVLEDSEVCISLKKNHVKTIKKKNNASLENSTDIKEINNQLKITQDELQEERKKLEDKTKQCDKLFLDFSELEMKYFNLQKKVLIKNEQITKHIFKIKEHELTLESLLKEHNSVIEKLNIQQNILCKYTDMIKEKDNLIKHYKEDFEKLHFIYLEEINHIHNNFENREILTH
ncbi:hypothetical protein T552_02455 [Pneumocystis carinii B80]|uniref:Uncharacterized protein n=1 Tax=Pneumocystis carinii (strain B80) TaxID=1408658 RepID=A0A0W4ZF06_PNEC8|nr:hypothetical protein T552_02455 [Pneumocystis carinii B80]KTW26964.1 hypothetical protein T552_02455 [Pneumocystis carinii B80]